ncbi:tail fiber domain-containing protein [Kluyvera intermedia]|uniref:Peptidase S74 domain-containing protein n=1 Tax=Kluyvera intermedia TaxID=61648 RepID=A0ABX6DRI4_KLUIN|nr:tail fiber domain-containing protein [Kluyvera intermedia]QGH29786.1 hypothetical protein GHC21_08980 [Kluyvera intermedia]QGH38768.1 hypothetical protein GHC38_08980 [Kluyvera intermedia]
MSITNIFANLLDSSKSSLLQKVRALEFGVRRLENRTKVYVYNDVSQIGITATTATCRSIKNNMNLNSRLVLSVSGGNFPNLDTPARSDATGYQSGTIEFTANQLSPDRFSCIFYNENGMWYRYFSEVYVSSDPHYDSGWIWISTNGMQEQLSASSMTSKYSGLLSNIKEPREYFISGSALNASVTDSPYGTTGNPSIWISVTRMQSDRGVIQTVRDNTATQSGYRRQISSSGTVGPWVQELTSRTDATTQHMSPRTPNAYNVGGVSNAYANGYFQNAITVVSDRNHKPIEEAVPDKILDIWGRISPKRYKYDWAIEEKGAEGARWHVGWIAQDILEAFAEAGEDATEWALITYNEWDESDGVPAGHQWRLVMDECLALEALYQRRRLTKIEDAIA